MNTLNKIRNAALILAMGSLVLTSCEDDDEEETPTPATTNTVVNSNISANTTWTSDNIYQLGGRITVLSGATLTIEPGTIIKGEAGSGANATALIVARGGILMAEGTAAEPIIFTSIADDITQADIATGDFSSPNLSPSNNGFWGGVIVLGAAPISTASNGQDVTEIQIEGIPTSDPNGLYGGSNSADNSGILRYISIRHGGTNIGSGNEINGLSLGGVGSGTVIDHIEIVGNQDDGVEWFGGSVNVTNVVSWNCGDDGIDTDMAWTGTLDNFVVIGAAGHAFELDGPEGSLTGGHTITNGSIKMTYVDPITEEERVSQDIINVDANSDVVLSNLYFTGLEAGQLINRVTAPAVSFENIVLNVPADEVIEDFVNGDVPTGVTNGTTPFADVSVFGWTWADQYGALSGL